MKAAPLAWQRLRALTLPAAEHPRGQPYLSAASGLVCANGRVYVVGDDEHHLAIFSARRTPGRLHRLLAGDLPKSAGKRKRRKADFETLVLLPAGVAGSTSALLTLGSGSKPQRELAVCQPLDAQGGVMGSARRFKLAPLYRPLRERLGEINIEGALCAGPELLLFNRGGSGQRGRNAVARFDLAAVLALAAGQGSNNDIPPSSLHMVALGEVKGVGYGFTDAAALPADLGGGCLFTAVAEASADSVADGDCVGSALGRLGATGELMWLRPLRGAPKVEGIDLLAHAGGVSLCLVTDADDPERPSWLVRARL